MLTLLLGSWHFPALATAATVQYGNIEKNIYLCSGECIDVWKVDCKSKATTYILVNVKDPLDNGNDSFAVHIVGYKSKGLIGQAQRTVSQLGTTDYSGGAMVLRPEFTAGAMSALVEVYFNVSGGGSIYQVQFACYDKDSYEVADPIVKLLQDE